MDALVEKLTPNTAIVGLSGGLVVVVGLLIIFLIAPYVQTYVSAIDTRSVLRETAAPNNDIYHQIAGVEQEVLDLEKKLHGDVNSMPAKELEVFIIGRLQEISWRNEVKLISMKPNKGASVHVFRELRFNVSLIGKFHSITQWVEDLRDELGFVVVKKYSMRPVRNEKSDAQIQADITIVTYRRSEA